MPERFVLHRDGVRLAGLDFGGSGPAVVLLHGLAGHAGEWSPTAAWLTERARVVALDARGHGDSERGPADVSPGAHVADVAYVIEEGLGLGPAVVVGQSLGGVVALRLAAARPGLVRGLVVAEAGPGGGPAAAASAVAGVEAALGRWPVPFASRQAALPFFGGASPAAQAWADGLEERDGGWWPRFDVGVLLRTLREAVARPSWDAWEAIACPALVVRAGAGDLSAADAEAMARRGAPARLVEVPDAGHDVHLDAPDAWRAALEGFLDELG